MKSIKTLFVALTAFVFTSCTKEDVNNIIANNSVTVGFQVAGIPIQLTFGGSGNYYSYSDYGSYVYNPSYTAVTACYVTSKPFNPESIDVYDKNGKQIGTVRCDQGVGSQTGVLFGLLQNWFSNHTGACLVKVKWDPQPFTNGAWEGTIVG